ncbi:MAG: hypothetical protein GY724_01525 [Actinomycetia bacterium]|nr:hypothetical protein [Actinomycetes bacterium]
MAGWSVDDAVDDERPTASPNRVFSLVDQWTGGDSGMEIAGAGLESVIGLDSGLGWSSQSLFGGCRRGVERIVVR